MLLKCGLYIVAFEIFKKRMPLLFSWWNTLGDWNSMYGNWKPCFSGVCSHVGWQTAHAVICQYCCTDAFTTDMWIKGENGHMHIQCLLTDRFHYGTFLSSLLWPHRFFFAFSILVTRLLTFLFHCLAVLFFPSVLWHCWFGNRKDIRPIKSWMLVCWWWRFDWSFARLLSLAVTTTSFILSSNKTQNGDILVPTYPVVLENGRETSVDVW